MLGDLFYLITYFLNKEYKKKKVTKYLAGSWLP